jgi:hypothetical protein
VNDWKVIPTIAFATVLIFGAGVFTGGILVDYVKQARPRAAAQHQPKPPNPLASTSGASTANATNPAAGKPLRPSDVLMNKDFLQRLDGEIHLTKDEHDAIQKIISDGQNQIHKVFQDSRLEIREILTADQRGQFDALMKRPFRKPIFNTNAPPAAALTNAP